MKILLILLHQFFVVGMPLQAAFEAHALKHGEKSTLKLRSYATLAAELYPSVCSHVLGQATGLTKTFSTLLGQKRLFPECVGVCLVKLSDR